jgi:hypothetical protein
MEQSRPDEFDRKSSKLAEALAKAFSDPESDMARAIARQVQAEHEEISQTWNEQFISFRLFLAFALEAGQGFQREFLADGRFEHDPLLGALMRHHALGIRVGGEVIELLEGGYPDAAFARWRTLHELAVYSVTILNYGSECAARYIEWSEKENLEGALEFNDSAAEMEREPIPEQDIDAIKNRLKAIRDHWVSNKWINNKDKEIGFGGQNAWARIFTKTGKFHKLQEFAGMQKWRNDYKAASLSIHPTTRTHRALLGAPRDSPELLLVGRSNSGGIADPAIKAAIAISQITMAFLHARINDSIGNEEAVLERIANMKALEILCDAVEQTFFQKSREIDKES